MVGVEVQVTEGVDEFLRLKFADLSDHHGQKRVGGDVEWDAEKDIGAPLVELAAQLSICDVELKERMARGEGHTLDLSRIPGADDGGDCLGCF